MGWEFVPTPEGGPPQVSINDFRQGRNEEIKHGKDLTPIYNGKISFLL
jgi:hypothetical protein